jgi:hypothetical protein
MAGIIEVKDQGKVRIYDADNSNYIDIVVPSTVSANRTITIPDATFTIPTSNTPDDDAITAAKLNNDIISGTTALTSEPADTDEFLVSDAGTLKRIDYSLIKPSSDFVKISTTSVSSATSSVSLTGMDSTYKNYKIIVNDIEQASHANGNFRFINASGDITSSAYYGAISGIFNPYNSGIGDANVGDYNTSSARVSNFDYSTNASHASSFEMLIPNPSNSATYPVAYGQSFINSQNGSYVISQIFGYTHTSASAVTGIKFYISDGTNIDGGNFSLYGIKG